MKNFAFALFLSGFVIFIQSVDAGYGRGREVRLERPEFSLAENQPEDRSYQVRRYEAAKWVSTVVTTASWEAATSIGFQRLFRYIQGANDAGMQINMTAPVLTEVRANPCVFCPSNYTISFYIPALNQANPPSPLARDVYIDSATERTFYVKYFGGWATPNLSKMMANQLYRDLYRNNVTADELVTDRMYVAGYDSPMKWRDRRNEVWFRQVKKEVLPRIESEVSDKANN